MGMRKVKTIQDSTSGRQRLKTPSEKNAAFAEESRAA
jgi:hypothetical protein